MINVLRSGKDFIPPRRKICKSIEVANGAVQPLVKGA